MSIASCDIVKCHCIKEASFWIIEIKNHLLLAINHNSAWWVKGPHVKHELSTYLMELSSGRRGFSVPVWSVCYVVFYAGFSFWLGMVWQPEKHPLVWPLCTVAPTHASNQQQTVVHRDALAKSNKPSFILIFVILSFLLQAKVKVIVLILFLV